MHTAGLHSWLAGKFAMGLPDQISSHGCCASADDFSLLPDHRYMAHALAALVCFAAMLAFNAWARGEKQFD
jgi:hypothetical protein